MSGYHCPSLLQIAYRFLRFGAAVAALMLVLSAAQGIGNYLGLALLGLITLGSTLLADRAR